jgi:hypothetical protein
MHSTYLSLRSRLVQGEEERARHWQRQIALEKDHEARRDQRSFEQAMAVGGRGSKVRLARAVSLEGTTFWAGLPARALLSMHSWITGSTGAGKSFFVLALLLQVLRSGRHPVVLVDLKGELSSLLTQVALPQLAQTDRGCQLLERLRIIRPFDARYVPELRITLPEPGVPREVQAFAIAAAIEDTIGNDLGIRMNRVFLKIVSLAIERNQPLTVLQQWLEQPRTFEDEARSSADPVIRQYAAGTFAREARASVDALIARLDVFLFLRQTRLALSTPGCVSFADCLDRGVTVINLGDPPAGAERAARFWAGILVGRLSRAILSRRLTDRSRQTWVLFEEFQEAVSGKQTEQFARLLALARHKRVGLTFINQQIAQLDSGLVKLLRTNADLEAIFRSNFEDAKSITHALPLSGDPKQAHAERQRLLEEIPRLPNRTFYLWLKNLPFRAQKVRSPRLDLAGLRVAGTGLPEEIRAFLERGIVALPREGVEAALQRAGEARKQTEPTFSNTDAEDRDDSFPRLG